MTENKKIIIVEDEFDFAKMVKLRLESVGYEVHIAGDAYQGTQMIIKEEYDLIVLDLMMPAGGGFALLERIRILPKRSTTPVIIMTGKRIDDNLKSKAEELNASAIFSKPYNSTEFVKKIKSLVPID